MKSWRLCLLACAALMTSHLAAQEPKAGKSPGDSGNAFMRYCSALDSDKQNRNNGTLSLACVMYANGVIEGVYAVGFLKSAGKEMPNPFCAPENSETGQLIRITMKYIRNHPEEAHRRTSILIVEALAEAFPCGKKP